MQEAIDFLTAQEPVFKTIITRYGVPIIPKRPPGFETLVLLILEQQVSIASAKACFLKLKEVVEFFSPAILYSMSDENYRALGVSRQKTSYIKALSSAILQGEINLENLQTQSSEQVRNVLIKIKGIGNWTIDVYLIFSLGATDIIPIGDIAILNTIKELWKKEYKNDILQLVETWAPHKTVATFLLWHYYLEKRGIKVSY